MNCYVVQIRSAQPCVQFAIASAVATLGRDRVFLITDGAYKTDACESIPAASRSGSRMSDTYRRSAMYAGSPMREFEDICISRWGILLDRMVERGENRSFVMDSDVLLFDDPAKVPHATCDIVLTRHGCWSGGSSIVTVNALKAFMDALLNANGNVLNDMDCWSRCVDSGAIHPCDGAIPKGGFAFDHNIGVTDGWEPDADGKKSIQWEDRRPYATNTLAGRTRMACLHFWSPHRHTIGDAYKCAF